MQKAELAETHIAGFWQKLCQQVLCYPEPHTLVSWRFLLPGQSKAIRLHRRVFLGAWPKLSRWSWVVIVLYSAITWMFFFSWKQIYTCMRDHSGGVTSKFGVSARRQCLDLVGLALLHAIPAYAYYEFTLFCRPREQWLEYIYPHESAQWHLVHSLGVSERTLHYMRDKKAFSEMMASLSIASVETFDFLCKGEPVVAERLFSGSSCFLKPNCGSQAKGAYILSFDEVSGKYALIGKGSTESNEKILAFMNNQIQQYDYLVQPLLQNHPEITALYGQKLVVLRLVTGVIRGKSGAIFARLEVPSLDEPDSCLFLDVDVSSGRILREGDESDAEYANLIRKAGGKELRFWKDAVDIATRAHASFSDLSSIGWDIAMTPSGVRLLEGNFCWGVDAHQYYGGPALATALIDVYD